MRPLLLVGSFLLALSASAQTPRANADLARAKKSIEAFKYADASKALDAAWAAPGNDRPTVLEILKLQGVVAATLGQAERARTAFRHLLYLAPDFELRDADLGPKVTTLFYECRGRISADTALLFGPALSDVDTEAVRTVGVTVKSDPLRLVKLVRFHLGDAATKDLPPGPGGLTSVPVNAPTVRWWAELLGDKERVLALVGAPDRPLEASKVTLEPVVTAPPPPPGVDLPAPRDYRPAAYVVGGLGAAAAVGGAAFAVQSSAARATLATAERDAAGVVTGLTREQGLALDRKVRTNAIIANSLFAAAAALVGTGVTLFFLSDRVAVTAAPGGGLGVTGALP